MPRGKKSDDGTKAAVIGALLAGQGVNETADKFGIPHRTVSEWNNALPDGEFARIRAKRAEEIDQLVHEYLVENLKTLKWQAQLFRDEAYVRKYPLQQVSLCHGISADKAGRIMEAHANATGAAGREDSAEVGPGASAGGENQGAIKVVYAEDNSSTETSRSAD